MHVLHVTAHLGGGVGKAHAALRAAMPAHVRQTYLLLEQPRDRRYADEISARGGEIVVVRGLDDLAARCASGDIVQFEFWNHPKLFECLARLAPLPMRSVFWCHVSGLFRPVIPPDLLASADRFVFTTPASLKLGDSLSADQQRRLSAIGSGFGFDLPATSGHRAAADGSAGAPGLHPIAYLGTVDFVKMHPGFFEAIDALSHDTDAAIWGACAPDGDVVRTAKSMRHPHRIRFMGQTADPQAALSGSRLFFYPLQADHYGTAENALIEAMSMGLVPVVLSNPAEQAIVEDGVTGFIACDIAQCTDIINRLLADPAEVELIGANAARAARDKHSPARSAEAFATLWSGLIEQPKHPNRFSQALGQTPRDWYLATQPKTKQSGVHAITPPDTLSKGTLAHFRAAFPDDPCWQSA